MDIEEALSQAEEMREKLTAERDRLDAELADLDIEIRGLRAAHHRFSPAAARTAPTTSPPVEPFRQRPRTSAIEMVMRDATMPMSPEEIRVELQRRGRDDTYHAVSAAMAHLARKRRIHSIGRAQWVLGPGPEGPIPMSLRPDVEEDEDS